MRIDPLRHRQPGFVDISWRANRVFDMLLSVSGMFRLNGALPPEYWAPEYLAREFAMTDYDVGGIDVEHEPGKYGAAAWVEGGLAELIARGTVEKLPGDNASIVIPNWERHAEVEPRRKASAKAPSAASRGNVLQFMWNEACKENSLQRCLKMNPDRQRKCDALMQSYTPDDIQKALSLLSKSPFLMGKNDRGWQADFEFFIRPNSIAKILEGKYVDRAQSNIALGVKLVDTTKDLYE